MKRRNKRPKKSIRHEIDDQLHSEKLMHVAINAQEKEEEEWERQLHEEIMYDIRDIYREEW